MKLPLFALMFSISLSALAYSEREIRSVIDTNEAEIERVRNQEIGQLKIVMGRHYKESRRPDLLLRLAELEIEAYRFYFLKENEFYQKLIKEGKRPRRVEHQRSQEHLKRAASICQTILQSNVPFNRMDQVYYFLGYNFGELGKQKESEKYYAQIVRQFPKSPYAVEAYRSLGEKAFDNKKYTEAVKHYEKAAAVKGIESLPRTLYKLAWSYFKTRRYDLALSTMRQLIRSADAEKFVGLKDEALGDLVSFYAEAGKWTEAKQFFSEIADGPDLYIRSLSRLSKIYESRGEYRLALNVNRQLVSEFGDNQPALVFELLARNVQLHGKLGDSKGEQEAIFKVVAYYKRHTSAVQGSAEGQALFVRIKNALRKRATETHKAAEKKKISKLYSDAADLYAEYLNTYLKDAQDPKDLKEFEEIRFYRADALISAGRTKDASVELEKVFREDSDQKRRRESGATLLGIYGKLKNEAKFTEIASDFEHAFPSDKLVPDLKYQKAKIEAAKTGATGFSSTATQMLEEFIALYPNRYQSVEAANDLVADAVKRKNQARAIELSSAFLKNTSLMQADKKGELRKYLNSVVSRSSFNEAQDVEKQGDFAKAASQYLAVAKNSKDADVIYRATFNAAVNFEKAGNTEEAFRVYLELANSNHRDAKVKTELKRIVGTSFWQGQFAEAAKGYKTLLGINGYSADEHRSFFITAVRILAGTGDKLAAGSLAEKEFENQCGRMSSVCHDVAFELAQVYQELGRYDLLTKWMQRYLQIKDRYLRKSEANYYLAFAARSKNKPDAKAAARFLEAASVKGNVMVREKNHAAHAAFLLVEPTYEKFRGIKLQLPESKLKTSTRQKLSQLETLVARYQTVVGMGDGEWGIAALERLSDAFSEFARELVEAPIPPKLDEKNKAVYKAEIQSIANKLQERSYEFLRKAYDRGTDLRVTSSTFVALTMRLALKAPKEFPPVHFSATKDAPLRFAGPIRSGDWQGEIGRKLKENPRDAKAWLEFGNLTAGGGKLRLARLLYSQALELDPKNADAQHNLGVVSFLENNPLEATAFLQAALRLKPNQSQYRLTFGKILLAYHHFKAAEASFSGVEGGEEAEDLKMCRSLTALGLAKLEVGKGQLENLGGKGSRHFSVWYNWSVAAGLLGDRSGRQFLEDHKDGNDLGDLEKQMIGIALKVLP